MDRLACGLVLPLLASCTTIHYSDRSANRSDLALISEAFPYAQLAYNAYHRDSVPFDVGPRFQALQPPYEEDNIGLAFDVYEDTVDRRTVFVFRGTEPGSCDWRYGNLSREQQRRAAQIVNDYRSSRNLPSDSLVLVGHSLGAGIATHISFRQPGSRVYGFNGSPVFRKPAKYQWQTNPTEGLWGRGRWIIEPRRLSIVTRGEFLKLGRLFGQEANQIYLPISCPDGADVVAKHSMRSLARCLTEKTANSAAASIDARAEASASIRRNLALFPPPGSALPPDPPRKLNCDR